MAAGAAAAASVVVVAMVVWVVGLNKEWWTRTNDRSCLWPLLGGFRDPVVFFGGKVASRSIIFDSNKVIFWHFIKNLSKIKVTLIFLDRANR